MEDYTEFLADNIEEVAEPQEVETDAIETETEITEESTETVEVAETKELTETQRVSQRINEARQQAKDEFIASQGYEWNGKAITTEKEYKQALAEQAEQQRNAKLQEQGIDPNIVKEAVESDPSFIEAKEMIKAQVKQIEQNKMLSDFVAEYPDVKPEQISKETWERVNRGSSLVDAYARQEAQELKAKLKVYEQNEKIGKKAPIGSVTSHGSVETAEDDDFLKGFNSY